MNTEIALDDDWMILVCLAGRKSSLLVSRKMMIEQLVKLARQSEYAPTSAQIEQFADEVFSDDALSKELKILGLLFDPKKNVRGFFQVRHFDGTADLDFILIDELLRKQGFARRLMTVMEDCLRAVSASRILLEVGIQNQPAARLYEKIGFNTIAKRKAYYRSSEDALVMEKIL